MIIVCYCSLLIGYAAEINGHLCEKYCCSCMIGGWEGVKTQRRSAILGNRSKRLGNTGLSEGMLLNHTVWADFARLLMR